MRPLKPFLIAPLALALLAGCAVITPGPADRAAPAADEIPPLDIPFREFTLENGLRVVIHEDHKAPIVAVNLWYHVGSKDEVPGKTGFAHLFEHLMFNGSEHHDDEFFRPLENVGATGLNGTTNVDRTNYYGTVPSSALDLVLWLESDRMGHLLGAVTQAKLDEQRDVVKNEKRQRENQPYGKVWDRIVTGTYPPGHPYSWSTIGSMEDLEAASLEDVHAWFRRYYGPNNATLVIAGDVDTEAALARVRHYFGSIEPGPAVSRRTEWIAPMQAPRRERIVDAVPQHRIYKVWNIPGLNTRAASELDLLSDVLGSGKNSRLYQRLVYHDQTATEVSAGIWPKELGSQFIMTASVQPGGDVAAVEAAMHEELHRLLADGPDVEELERVRTRVSAGFIRGAERVGGSSGKSGILARSTVFGGSPDAYKRHLKVLEQATPADLSTVGRQWLNDGVYTLVVEPRPSLRANGDSEVDRSRLPTVGQPPDLRLPAVQTATLANGIQVLLAQRTAVPLVEVRMLFDAGYAADQFARPGTASVTMAMLDEGTGRRDALGLSAELDRLGARLSAGANVDQCRVSLSALTPQLPAALDIMSDVLRNPAFPAEELARMKPRWLASIAQEKTRPNSLAFRLLPPLLYGQDHAYSQPLTGSGTEDSIAALTREELQRFHQAWIRPEHATLVVVGDIDMPTLKPMLETRFGNWTVATPPAPAKTLDTVAAPQHPRVFLIDRPGAQQSVVLAGQLIPGRGDIDEAALRAMNALFGGNFTARLNMNLREDKGWAYGASSFVPDTAAQRPFILFAPVQTDRTADAMLEMLREARAMGGSKPVAPEELSVAKNGLTLELPGSNETSSQVAGTLAESVRFGLDPRWYEQFVSQVQSLSTSTIDGLARQVISPDRLTWVVIGDLDRIEAPVRALNLGPVQQLDANGKQVPAP
ncbi:MAG: pitrilysin family protein [Abyssibacter sp.]|uniref:M16 family metallopeptidase n=1 Tax=Abyssibacter sp. TaxID=2320200 RepID=UPI00321AAED3